MISKKMQAMLSKGSAIRAMFEEGKRLSALYGAENVYDFSLGNPNTPTPEKVKEAIIEVLEGDSVSIHGYMLNAGYPEVRQAVAENINKRYGANLSYENVVMTVGAAGGLNVTLKVLLDEGDEVIIIAPYFGEYLRYIDNFGGKAVIVPPNPPTFLPNITAFENAITSRTKAVIINTPNNPTGVVYDDETLKAMAEVLERKEKEYGNAIYLISDEPYREILFEDAVHCYIPHYYKNTIVGYSYSKSLSLPGERIGYLIVPSCLDSFADFIKASGDATRTLGFVNAPSLMQKVVALCLDEKTNVDFYAKNRHDIYTALTKMGYQCAKPQGAFYIWCKALEDDDKAFCERAKQFNILVVPGTSFGCKGWFRLAYCVSNQTIQNSLPAFQKLIDSYKN